jgi:hypothetical protein
MNMSYKLSPKNINFIAKFRINSRIIASISSKELLKLSKNIELPYNQRICDDMKVKEIINYQQNYYKNHNKFNLLGLLNFHYCIKNSIYYLIDGQHRYEAIKKMADIYPEFPILIEIVLVKSMDEMIDNYNIINKNTELPPISDNINIEIHKKIFKYYEEKFNTLWSLKKSPKRPNINKNDFQGAISFLLEKLPDTIHNNLIDIIDDYNIKMGQWDINKFPNIKNLKSPDEILKKCRDKECYFGMFNHLGEDYHYQWVINIIKNETGEEIFINKKTKYKKKSIPKGVKNDSWKKYIGKDIGETSCPVCRSNKISQMNFIAGHIISEVDGGDCSVKNIIPICLGCNSSMGTQNLIDYTKEYYPDNKKLLHICLKK